jgi:hypothetical protein
MGGNDHVNGAASRLPRGHRSTKVSIAISEVCGERECRFPSAAQYAADSDRIKNRLYDHRNLRTHYRFQLFVVDSQTHDSKAVAIKSSGAATGVADRRYAVHRTDSDGVRKA